MKKKRKFKSSGWGATAAFSLKKETVLLGIQISSGQFFFMANNVRL